MKKLYQVLEMEIVLIPQVDIVTASPFSGDENELPFDFGAFNN